jgi:hypothetical protein
MLRAVIKRSSRTEGADDSIRHRLIPDDAVKSMYTRLEDIKDETSEVLKEEKIEKEVRCESVLTVVTPSGCAYLLSCESDPKRRNGDQERSEYD